MSQDGVTRTVLSCYCLLLLAGAVMDVRARRVPNLLVVALLVLGIGAGAAHVSLAATVPQALLAGAVGLIIWIPFWFLGLLGAGDVKFFAAGSAWLGPALAWRAGLGAALLGGALAAIIMARTRGVRSTTEFGVFGLTNAGAIIREADAARSPAAYRTFPYAVPMAIVLAAAAYRPWLFP